MISILVFLGSLVKIQLLPLRDHRDLSSPILPALLKWESHRLCPQDESKQQQRWNPVCICKRGILLKASKYHGRLKIKVVFVFGVQL